MKLESSSRMTLLVAIATCAALTVPAVAAADDDRREVRKAGMCTGSSKATVRLRAEDGEIRVEFEVVTRSTTRAWSMVLVHERRVAFQGSIRPKSRTAVRLRRTVADWFGKDTIVIRASGPGIETCRVSATV